MLIFIGLVLPAFSQQKVDPLLGLFPASVVTTGPLKAMAVSQRVYDVFVKTNDVALTKEAIEDLGGKVKIAVGDLLTALIPESALETIADRDEVVFIESAKPISIHNDLALKEINADQVHQGLDLPLPLTGANTIIGIVDTGIDYNHPDFQDASGSSRILYVWDQTSSGGAGPNEIDGSYGVECDKSMLESGKCPVRDESGHGTHITGTAAGRNETYGGVAPDASIIAVRYKAELGLNGGYADPVFSTTICEGAYYVFKKAEELKLPAVVNLSLGTHIGPHDGTSLFEQCLDALVEGSSGRAIVAAVGNETSSEDYFTGLHAGYDVSGNYATNFEVRSFSAGRIFYLDIWGSKGSDLSFGLEINRKTRSSTTPLERTDMIDPGSSTSGAFVDGKISYQINATETRSALNGRPHVGMAIKFSESIDKPDAYSFDLVVSGTGHFDAWWYPDKPATAVNFTSVSGTRFERTFVPGDRKMSIAIPSTAKNVIGVAAYSTRNRWDHGTGCCQVSYKIGDLLGFSSVGPSADPATTGQKPEIAAPGAMIASARSMTSKVDDLLVMPDGDHVLMAGTSMSAPFVTGTIALLFQANPYFTYEDVEQYITESAYVDDFVGQAPNDKWGFGKLDVLAAVEKALGGKASSAGGNPELSLPQAIQSTPSCQIVTRASPDTKSPVIIVLLFALTTTGLILRRISQMS
jgi:subtilisin family serine protease